MDKLKLMNDTVLETFEEIKLSTSSLDKATLCPIKIIDTGVEKDVNNFRAVYNVSKGLMAAAVGKSYHLIQHKEYFDTFCEALNNLNIKYKAIINQSKSMAVMDVIFDNKTIKFTDLNEEFTTGIRVINSYTRTKGLSICPRYTRLACTNGMVMSRFDITFSVRHNSKLLVEMEHLIETQINNIINKDEELKAWISDSMADSVEWTYATKLLEKLVSSAKHREGILKNLGISVVEEKIGKRKKKISYVLDNTKKKKLTRWDIYNGITQFCTHGKQLTPNIESFMQRQAEKILTTNLKKLPGIVVTV